MPDRKKAGARDAADPKKERVRVYKYAAISFALSFLGFIPILNIFLFLPVSLYLAWKALSLARAIPEPKKGAKHWLPIVLAAWALLNAVVVWIICAAMFALYTYCTGGSPTALANPWCQALNITALPPAA